MLNGEPPKIHQAQVVQGRGVQGNHFIARHLFAIGWLLFVQCLEKLVKGKLGLKQRVEYEAEFTPERSFFTES